MEAIKVESCVQGYPVFMDIWRPGILKLWQKDTWSPSWRETNESPHVCRVESASPSMFSRLTKLPN